MKPDTATIDIRAVALLVILCVSWGLNQVAIKVAIAGIFIQPLSHFYRRYP